MRKLLNVWSFVAIASGLLIQAAAAQEPKGNLVSAEWLEKNRHSENVLIIAPVTFFASLLRPRYSWLEWTALGFLAALLVEVIQAVALPDRSATFSDIVANTLGALVGALVVRFLTRTHR